MRTYGIAKSTIWNGPTGRELYAAGKDAQLLAVYLFSNPHANAIGLYYLPIVVIPSEVAMTIDEVRATFGVMDHLEYAHYDDPSQVVWVREMAHYQLGAQLDKRDGKVPAILKAYRAVPPNPFLGGFFDRYAAAFHLTERRDASSTGGRNHGRRTDNHESTDGRTHGRPSDSLQGGGVEGAPGGPLGARMGPPVQVQDLDLVPVQLVPERTSNDRVLPPEPPLDVWFRELLELYPEQGRTDSCLAQSAFHDVFRRDSRDSRQVMDELLGNLENQKAGYQWRVKRMVPNLDKWLREGRWKQRHDAAPPTALVSERTLQNEISGDAFVKGGRHGTH